MSQDTSEEGTSDLNSSDTLDLTAINSPYKVLGDLWDPNGIGVLGRNTATSGATKGVEGRVASSDGYGLYTPDDAGIEGMPDTAETDFVVEDGTTTTGDALNVVQGHSSNAVQDGAVGAVIGGGGHDDDTIITPNEVYDNYGTIGGGEDNEVGTDDGDPSGQTHATVAGGSKNIASSIYSTVAGGSQNTAASFADTVSGGDENTANGGGATIGGGFSNNAFGSTDTIGGGGNNTASGGSATVGGGNQNSATGLRSTIPGGYRNTADGEYSFAAGRQADTNGYRGSFVLGDSTSTTIKAQGADEVRSQMPIYAPDFIFTSARAKKTGIEPVDPTTVLERVESLSVHTWTFTDTDDGRHMGRMADDFSEQFDLGSDEESIATVDADGVAFAAIQGLSEQLNEKDDRIDDLETENEQLRDRLRAVEDRLASLEAGPASPATTDD